MQPRCIPPLLMVTYVAVNYVNYSMIMLIQKVLKVVKPSPITDSNTSNQICADNVMWNVVTVVSTLYSCGLSDMYSYPRVLCALGHCTYKSANAIQLVLQLLHKIFTYFLVSKICR